MPHTDSERISQNCGNRIYFFFLEAEEKVSFRGLCSSSDVSQVNCSFNMVGSSFSAESRQTAQSNCTERFACFPFSSKTGLYVSVGLAEQTTGGSKKALWKIPTIDAVGNDRGVCKSHSHH